MRRYLLDSNAVNDLINGRRKVRTRADAAKRVGGRIGTCYPVVAELYYGYEGSISRDQNIRLLRAGLARLTVWPFEHPAAQEFGRLRAELERIGRPMQIVDMQLAAIALTLGNCTVVSADSDLSAVPGLAVENWAV